MALTLERGRDYTMVLVSRSEDCEALGTAAGLRAIGSVTVPCGQCRKPCLASPIAMPMIRAHPETALVVCLQCSGPVADMMENLDEPTRAQFRKLARTVEDAIADRRASTG